MDHHVHEDAAGQRNVLCGWGLRVARRNAYKLHLADLAVLDRLAHCAVVVIVATVEADLIDKLLGACGKRRLDFFDLCYALVDRLFAEDVLACRDRFERELRVLIGRRADQNGVDARIVQNLMIIRADVFDADGLRPFGDLGLHIGVCKRDDLRIRHARKNALCVDLTDAARADDTDIYHVLPP